MKTTTQLALLSTTLSAVAANTPCPFGNPIFGSSIIYGLNQGGCFLCDDDDGNPLSGDDLVASCRQMCEDDPECKSFEVGNAALAPFYEAQNGDVANCCIEHDVVAYDHPMYLDARDAQYENTDCAKQASCWNSYVKSEYLKDENVLCDQNRPVIPAATNGNKGGADSLAQPQCRQITWPDESMVGAKMFQMIAKRKNWFKEGCPLIVDDGNNNVGILEDLLDDAYKQCTRDIEVAEANNRVEGSDDNAEEPTEKPSLRPTDRPTMDNEDDVNVRDDTSSGAYVKGSMTAIVLAVYVMFSV